MDLSTDRTSAQCSSEKRAHVQWFSSMLLDIGLNQGDVSPRVRLLLTCTWTRLIDLESVISSGNCCAILNIAYLHFSHYMMSVACSWTKMHSNYSVVHETFNTLSTEALCALLDRNSFSAPGDDIYKGVCEFYWFNSSTPNVYSFIHLFLYLLLALFIQHRVLFTNPIKYWIQRNKVARQKNCRVEIKLASFYSLENKSSKTKNVLNCKTLKTLYKKYRCFVYFLSNCLVQSALLDFAVYPNKCFSDRVLKWHIQPEHKCEFWFNEICLFILIG